MSKQPKLHLANLEHVFWLMGIQFGFAFQNANVSRIFKPWVPTNNMTPLWWPLRLRAAVQPIVATSAIELSWSPATLLSTAPYLDRCLASDAELPTLGLPQARPILDASINVSMEPFRALVGDVLPPDQWFRYALQSFFIGIGVVVASGCRDDDKLVRYR